MTYYGRRRLFAESAVPSHQSAGAVD